MLTAPLGADAGEHARHVGRHVPRPVQPDAARALPRRRPAAALPDPRHAGPARADQADVPAHNIDDERYPAARSCSGSSPTRRRRACGRTRSRPATTSRAARSSTTRCTRRCASAKASSTSPSCCCAATSCWRGNEAHPRALPAPLLAPAGRRVPGHQRAAVQVAAAAGRAEHGGVRRRRRRPVDLRVPRRERRQHAALRARLRHAGPAGAS